LEHHLTPLRWVNVQLISQPSSGSKLEADIGQTVHAAFFAYLIGRVMRAE
jgi:hypothetical protein